MNWRTRNFFRIYAKNGGNGTQAAMSAFKFKSEKAAAVHASKLIKTHKVSLREIMDAKGLTSEKLMAELKEGIAAEEVKVSTHEGEFIYSKPLKNLSMSHRNRELAHKLRGDLSTDINVELPDRITINFDPETIASKPAKLNATEQ